MAECVNMTHEVYEAMLAAARRDGAIEALDKLVKRSADNPPICLLVSRWAEELKSEYLKGQGNDGN